MKPQNFEEKVVWYYITGTYILYILGAQRDGAPAIALILAGYLCKKLWYQTDATPESEKITIPLPVWSWIFGMLVIEYALIIGHLDWELGTAKIIVSTIAWVRKWALLALFPLAGCLNIRPELVFRASCILCFQSLIIIPISYVASIVHFGANLYVSPLRLIGGGAPLFYSVSLYGLDGDGDTRISLFTPWAPALGFTANLYLQLAFQEADKKWRWLGVIGASAMIFVSVSRLARICIFIVPILNLWLSNLTLPTTYFITGTICTFGGTFGNQIMTMANDYLDAVKGQRASSTEVRRLLKEIAFYRWKSEAYMWGHGFMESKGPRIVEFMPIGSHHTWGGVLYMHGLVGAIGLAIPVLVSCIDLFFKAQKSQAGMAGLGVMLVVLTFSTAENLDALAYLLWPGFLMMGIAFKENQVTRKVYET